MHVGCSSTCTRCYQRTTTTVSWGRKKCISSFLFYNDDGSCTQDEAFWPMSYERRMECSPLNTQCPNCSFEDDELFSVDPLSVDLLSVELAHWPLVVQANHLPPLHAIVLANSILSVRLRVASTQLQCETVGVYDLIMMHANHRLVA